MFFAIPAQKMDPGSQYSVRKSINLMISIPSTEAVEFVCMARMAHAWHGQLHNILF